MASRLGGATGLAVVLFFIVLSVASSTEAVASWKEFPNIVQCTDTKYPYCVSEGDFYCSPSCPSTCAMDCKKCRPYCPPPPGAPRPPPPPPRRRYHSPPPSPPPPPATTTASPPPPVTTPASPPPPVTTTPSPPPPPSGQESAGYARCRNKDKKYASCYGLSLACPSSCPGKCQVDCHTCRSVCSCDQPGAVCQDPRFIGGDGLTFYFHGKKEHNFCIVSDPNLHINAHFIGKRNADMKRDFTWVQSIGILFDTHQLFIGAKKTSTWDDTVDRLTLHLDGESIYLPQIEGGKWTSSSSPITLRRIRETNSVEIEVEGNFVIKATVVPITEKESMIHKYGVTSEDCFAHLDLSFKFYSLSGDVNGVLGQTYGANYKSRVKMGVDMPVLGREREFASSDIFSTDCAASRFVGQFGNSSSFQDVTFESLDLKCATEENGRGVVCKR